MNKRTVLAGLAVSIAVLVGALYIWRSGDDSHNDEIVDGVVQDESGKRVLYWHDPMVPGRHFNRPGKSPFMDMQLMPKYAEEGTESGVRISPALEQNLGVRTTAVERSEIGDQVAAVGRIEADERRRSALPSRVSGYVERLYVRAVGDPVSKGAKVAELYSSELLSAQNEYLALLNASALSNSESLVQAARRRLVLFGMAEREIETITQSRAAQTRVGVYAPGNGFIIELNVREGAQIEAGASLMSIADLSQLWLVADVPGLQSDQLRRGARVTATVGTRELSGTIDYIYPELDPQTRTARVRVVLPNENGELRPGMLATVSLSSMKREALSVPSEAVIYTGERTVVIVRKDGMFRPVEVRVGAEGKGRTEILSGLELGQQVVTSGQFLIDSEASLSGAMARLTQEEEQQPRTIVPGATPASDASRDLISAAGRVISIDHATGRVTLQHGPIRELNWPEMTMPFRLADPDAAHTLAVGDVVRFSLRPKPDGRDYVIESVTKEAQR